MHYDAIDRGRGSNDTKTYIQNYKISTCVKVKKHDTHTSQPGPSAPVEFNLNNTTPNYHINAQSLFLRRGPISKMSVKHLFISSLLFKLLIWVISMHTNFITILNLVEPCIKYSAVFFSFFATAAKVFIL